MKRDKSEKQISIDIELKSNSHSQLSNTEKDSFGTNANTTENKPIKSNLNRKYVSYEKNYGVQITNEEFNKFLSPFFAGIDSEMYKFVTQKNKLIESIVNNKRRIKKKTKKLKYLRESLYSCYILEKDTKELEEECCIDNLDDEIIDFFKREDIIFYKNFPINDDKLVDNYIIQNKVNNKRKEKFKVFLDKKLEEVAYFDLLTSLENDIETIFLSKIKNKKLRKKEHSQKEILKKIELINSLKNEYQNVVKIESKFTEPLDLFDSSENIKNIFNFDENNGYF
ncbi:hypothetical protein TUBRATIS_005630 [Tubulinosema ratisbonensis]|uniref:Uncharacterized protein n=1 Tax=Tubulinosema ratisbonensis TaxID=291195 RepID=A0A437AP08_9MICR|nr:hypothetical protein TUBRATIS_005630 [Tubulinosema ratisbonensis]